MLAAAVFLAALTPFGQEPPALAAAACGSELTAAEAALDRIPRLDRDRLARGLTRATVLFRFRRTEQAIRQIDRVHIRLSGVWGQRVPAEVRHETLNRIAAFRDCVSTARPPAFAKLTVRTFIEDETKRDSRGQHAGAGVLIRVEDEPVGRTGRDGTLTAQVPSGPILVTAIIPPSQFGYVTVTLRAGGAATVSLVLQSDAEPGDEIDVDLVEAEDDVLQHTVNSFTLRLTRDDSAVPVTHVEEVKVLAPDGTTASYLDDLFTIRNGAVVAHDVARVLAALGASPAPIVLRIVASDKDALFYYGTVAFRIE